MNVNPFSYLINKISQKVSKSGDTMTGNLIISRNAATSELELGNTTTSKGLIILFSNNDKYEVLRSPDGMTANRNIYLPDASGTVALTSDIELKNIIPATSVGVGASEAVNLLSGFNLSDYNALIVDIYDSNWNRGTAFITRNPSNDKFSTVVSVMYGGSPYPFSVKQNSNTQFSLINDGVPVSMNVIIRGAKGF